ncbi:pheromone-regulated protein PRM7-like isoform X13 [Trichogramma pretiosum]|uniref:pheromone-regulated protein PRM7-like isoform X13 n=1 Tax=Trichogramma pretiosum TaxID=7493 RepID=UPI000C71B8C6|nr:pheromone-regulated protein PRM7-like isoform X13 [Trichogramma pretiosum]
MESRKDLVSVEGEPRDNWEDVANESVDPGISVKTEISEESSTNESSDEISIELETENVKLEPKPSLTTICQATVKKENPGFSVKTENTDESSTSELSANPTIDSMMKEKPRDNCEDVADVSVDPGISVKTENSEESSSNESSDEISIELETENVKLEPKPSSTNICQTSVKEENPGFSGKTENSDESSTSESSANPTNDSMMKEEPRDNCEDVGDVSVHPGISVKTENSEESSSNESSDEISIELETENVKLEPKPSLTTICQATVKEENPGFSVKTENSEESSSNESSDEISIELETKNVKLEPKPSLTTICQATVKEENPGFSMKTENSDESSTSELSANLTNDSMMKEEPRDNCEDVADVSVHPGISVKTENSEESSSNESSDEISIELETENVKLEPKPSLTTICQATVKKENPGFSVKTENTDESSTSELSANPTNDSMMKEEPRDNCEDVADVSVDPGFSVKTENSDESSMSESSDEISIELETENVKLEPKPSLTTICQATVKEENPGFSVKTENSDESSTSESSANPTNDSMMKEEPRDNCEDVADVSVDPGFSVKTENSEESSSNESSTRCRYRKKF